MEELDNLIENSKIGKENLFFKVILVIGIVCFICSILMYLYYYQNEDKVELIEINNQVINNTNNIKVDISGAIVNNGVYEINENERMEDLIVKAGGFLENADKEWVQKNLNLAAKLKDSQKIYIPFEGENYSLNYIDGNIGGKININTASQAELEKLSGIGEVTAKRIIEYREKNGNFENVIDLAKVENLGEKTIDKFKDDISF